jgi:uncharacterized protein (DUF58 family)
VSAPGPVVPPVRWRPASYALLATGAALLVAGFVLRNPVPLFVALPLLVAPVAAALVGERRWSPADLVWTAEGAGPTVELSGTVDFGPPGDPAGVEVHLLPPDGFVPASAPRLEPGPGKLEFRATWTVREPTLAVLPPPLVVWSDPLSLVERPIPGRRPELSVERYPPELLRLRAVRLDRTRAVPGETRSRRRGPHGEFFGLRDATGADSTRQINWRATARTGRWLVNEFELDLTGDLLLVLDARPTSLGPWADERLLSVGRAAALGISTAFLHEKSRVGYAAYGEFVESIVPLSTGRTQSIRIREAIVGTRRSASAGPGERCAVGLRRFFPRGITTLVISPGGGDPLADIAPYLQRQGWPSVMLSPSPLALRTPGGELPPEDERIAARLERLERRDRLSRLWVHCPVVDWNDLWSLEGLSLLFRRPARRRGL